MPDTDTGKNMSPNHLINEKSPYLLQHAYNPVNWYAWGDQPFEIARKENKPIFLSIGYSTCHWCHVMEKESFESEAIADILNKHFISIKVDREERPDVDQIYMLATQAMTGSGGWPMSVFLFADAKPFYAGTYFPPETRHNYPGFGDLLNSIARAWSENSEALHDSAAKITDFLVNVSRMESKEKLSISWSDSGFKEFTESYDSRYHGFGNTNKFPRPSCLDFLLAYGYRAGSNESSAMARKTLRAMNMGGMYDHIGGGYHRYSVDSQWRVPHFEKMLYDQAQLIVTNLHLYQQSGEQFFAEAAQDTITYVLRDLQHPDGGLYSAEDADSVNPYDPQEHSEGAFYLWKEEEIREILDTDTAKAFIACYGIRPHGNALSDPGGDFTGRNILYMEKSVEELAVQLGKNREELRKLLQESRRKLLVRRNKRTRPHLDDKIITSWNSLMISALAQAGSILGVRRYILEAQRITDFILNNLFQNKKLLRRWREGEPRFDGVLEDYAFFIQGLLDLHTASHDARYLHIAIDLSGQQQLLFEDPAGGFYSSQESAGLLTRMKETYDGAEPSGNSVSALNFLRLGRMLNRPDWIETGEKTIKFFGKILEAQGSAMPLMLKALELSQQPPQQLIICGDPDNKDTRNLLQKVNNRYLPFLQILLADDVDHRQLYAGSLNFIDGLEQVDGKATAYLCMDYSCQMPTNEAEELAQMLDRMTSVDNL